MTWGLRGVMRGKPRRTTVADTAAERPRDLVERRFSAPAPNRLWVADLTYVRTWSGFVYVAFVTDAYSRRIVGWQASRSLRSDLAINALEQAVWERNRTGASLHGLIHHSDRAGQYLSSLHRAPRRQRHRGVGGVPRRQLRQCPGRGHHRALQDRAGPPPRPLARPRRPRTRHLGMGRLVQPPAHPPPQRRPRPPSRSRGSPLPSTALSPPG